MPEEKDEKQDLERLAKAKLALSGEEELGTWKRTVEDFEKRRAEAARAMASEEQKKIWDEEEKARQEKIESQKKLAELESSRKLTEEEEKKKLSEEQKKKDEQAEAERIAHIDEILRSQKEIERIKSGASSGPTPIRTLTRDIGEAIGKEGLSATKIITQTPDKESLLPKESRSRSWLAGIGIILAIAGLIALVLAIRQRQVESLAPSVAVREGLLSSDKQKAVDLDKENTDSARLILKNEILSTLGGKEGIEEIYFTHQTKEQTDKGLLIKTVEADPSTVNEKLGLNLPNEFIRFLEPKMMLGLYHGQETSPFYLFKTKNYKNLAGAVLDNENLILSNLFSPFEDASSTAQRASILPQDKMIRNYDTRLILDETNTVIAIYAWLDKETLLFTTNENAFSQILNLYSSSK